MGGIYVWGFVFRARLWARQDCFWRRRAIAERRVGSLGVVMMSPSFDQHLGFTERGEDLGVQQLVPEFTVEAFVVAVFPGAPRRDVEGFDPNLGQPFPHRRGHELRTVIRSDVIWRAMLGEQIGQARQHVVAPEPPRHRQGQAFLRILVDHRQDAERPTVMGLVLHEVIAPDMARPAWPETDARSVVQPEPPAFGLFLGNF